MEKHSDLMVGRIVEERPRGSDVDDDEIVLLDRVFRITGE